MKRVSKNLTKAITLSVLLMLPYGITEAKEYDATISGKDDSYSKTYDDEKTLMYMISKVKQP